MGGESFIKVMMIFSLNNGRCMIQEGKCTIQVPGQNYNQWCYQQTPSFVYDSELGVSSCKKMLSTSQIRLLA